MFQEYHWAVFLTALIIPGGLLALGTYHLVKLGMRMKLQQQTEPERLEKVCTNTIYDNVIYLDNKVSEDYAEG
jgi:hypothetical protein